MRREEKRNPLDVRLEALEEVANAPRWHVPDVERVNIPMDSSNGTEHIARSVRLEANGQRFGRPCLLEEDLCVPIDAPWSGHRKEGPGAGNGVVNLAEDLIRSLELRVAHELPDDWNTPIRPATDEKRQTLSGNVTAHVHVQIGASHQRPRRRVAKERGGRP